MDGRARGSFFFFFFFFFFFKLQLIVEHVLASIAWISPPGKSMIQYIAQFSMIGMENSI